MTALVYIMAWRRRGDKPLYEPMMVSLPMHICVTRPQWVKRQRTERHAPVPYQTIYVWYLLSSFTIQTVPVYFDSPGNHHWVTFHRYRNKISKAYRYDNTDIRIVQFRIDLETPVFLFSGWNRACCDVFLRCMGDIPVALHCSVPKYLTNHAIDKQWSYSFFFCDVYATVYPLVYNVVILELDEVTAFVHPWMQPCCKKLNWKLWSYFSNVLQTKFNPSARRYLWVQSVSHLSLWSIVH